MLARAVARAAGAAADAKAAMVEFTSDGKLKKPVGYRKWVYVGTPLTPNDLNGAEASFPDFHASAASPDVYDEPARGHQRYSYPAWKGSFYPERLPARQMLRFYSEQFRTVEVAVGGDGGGCVVGRHLPFV
jgi:hypothetical protein